MAILAAVSALVAVVTLSLAAGRRLENLPGEEGMTPGAVLLLVGMLAAILAAGLAAPAIGRLHGERLRENPAGWALHVGPQYIQTTSATGRREFTWDRIQRVTIEEIQPTYGSFEELTCSAEYVYSGVHIWTRYDDGATALRPAGWPYPWLGSLANREDGLLPICVLGPMTEQQRTALTEALARYGGQR
ncbi:hypothetical protein [Streptomyces sp. GS7]|uniref:hypothetical protein n=1 Tax=Streptomyces sp. GS7 TaxID=2692234 RepID=UPI00131658DA|nr:hypothetical protein [Streptomyces sp. GS7]QHC25043.1 hypothetical protein GR130_30455 [Streptomyces sp. GS7]